MFLLSTGSEATENCIKLAKTYALEKHGPPKKYFVTLQERLPWPDAWARSWPAACEQLKKWMVDRDQTFVQVPFPDGYKNRDTSFDLFLQAR